MKLVSLNPSRNYEVIGEVEASTEEDIKEAVAKAKKAQADWANLSLADRCSAIRSFVEIVKTRAQEVAEHIATETGRTIDSSLNANLAGGIKYFEAYLEMAEEALKPKVTFETDTEIHKVYREPRGVIACICPWNYPFQNVAWQCGQALIAGNTVVYKNSEENPLFGKLLAELFAESEVPDGIFNVVFGDGSVGEMLARADIDMISFTGSTATGQHLSKIAAEKFIPIVTELGGSAPCIVFEDADIDQAFFDFIWAYRYKNAGQACDAIKRLIVHESKFDEVVKGLCELIKSKKIGDALDKDTDIGPLVARRQLEKLEAQVDDAVSKGAQVEIGGRRPEHLSGAYYSPTVLTNITTDMKVWQEEVFGPVLPIVKFTTEQEAINLANDTDYGLGAHVMTSDKDLFERVARKIQSGMVAQNKVVYGNPRNPFGGYKLSGMGRVNGEFGFHEVTQIKLVSRSK